MARLHIYGTGGFARQVLPMVTRMAQNDCDRSYPFDDIVFVDDRPFAGNFGPFAVEKPDCIGQGDFVSIAVSSNIVRRKLAQECNNRGAISYQLHANTSLLAQKVQIGEGSVLCDFTIVEPFVNIGAYFHANIYSYVAHDCKIGNFVTFAPRVSCNGNVIIADNVFIGAGAVIRQGTLEKPLRIGRGATIGMGAVVTKDVVENSVVVGNPATEFKSKDSSSMTQ